MSVKVLITGGNGQLAKTINELSDQYPYNFIFKSKESLDISIISDLKNYFVKNKINTIINCAAYTNVNKAENDKVLCDKTNKIGVCNLVEIAKKFKVKFLHISTDYVFDGKNTNPYNENDQTNPVNYYGKSKLDGENILMNSELQNSMIIRTSWLYSKYDSNFVKIILKKILNLEDINLISNEVGSPTYAKDLAKVILDIIPLIKNESTEIYHFSNNGYCSRLELIKMIYNILNMEPKLIPRFTQNFLVKRPCFSALNSNLICDKFNLKNRKWDKALYDFIQSFIK